MSTETTTAKKQDKPSIAETVDSLSGFETDELERHFGVDDFTDLTGLKLTRGLIYALKKRTDDTVTWDDMQRMTVKELGDFFSDGDEQGNG